jgi:hypothetical protein
MPKIVLDGILNAKIPFIVDALWDFKCKNPLYRSALLFKVKNILRIMLKF